MVTIIYLHFTGQETETHLSRASKWQNQDSTSISGPKAQTASLLHPHQVDANIIPMLWKGKSRVGGDLVSLHLGANETLSSNTLK